MCDNEDNNNAQPLNGAIPTTEQEQYQDYTSFVFEKESNDLFIDCKVGYFNTDGKCILIAELGDMDYGSKTTEIQLPDESIKDIYFFCYYENRYNRFNQPFKLTKKIKNTFKIVPVTVGIYVDKNDDTQYPH